jgi:cyclopropane fatty-acyl-phospholipid synthase-like methyltransferase
LIEEFVEKDARILELGCGNSALAADMYADGYTEQVIAVDFSKEVIDQLKKVHKGKDR